MEKIVHTINGINYVSFKIENSPLSLAKKFADTAEQTFKGITRHAKVNHGIFFTTMDVEVLIPEDRAIEFTNYKSK